MCWLRHMHPLVGESREHDLDGILSGRSFATLTTQSPDGAFTSPLAPSDGYATRAPYGSNCGDPSHSLGYTVRRTSGDIKP